jgi:hypothetical protein
MKYAYIAGVIALASVSNAQAQLNLGVDGVGLSIGNSQDWRGVRLNYRDSGIQDIRGINVTVLAPKDPASGSIRGAAIGLLSTGAREIHGLGIGLVGIAATDNLSGAMIGGLGAGAGGNISGLVFGGLGAGAGGDITGIAFGGFGLGAGGDIKGLSIGGFGLGAGGNITGISIGGFGLAAGEDLSGASAAIFGMGAGGDMTGFGLAGFGLGAGGSIKGIHFAGFGMGAGDDITGIHIAGFGLGAGGTIKGASAAFFGIGADRLEGLNLAGTLRARQMVGIAIAPAYLRVNADGNFHGLGVSAYNEIRGHTTGLTIGLVNYTRTLNGVQLGLVNVVSENPRHRQVLPVVNWNFD